jgi:acetolactate synthase-1/2/3 large subunit
VAETNYKDSELKHALSIIKKAKRPYILAGGGIISADASEELIAFAQKLDAPVGNTLMGLSSFPRENDLSTGLVGMHGTKASNMGMVQCDLLIAVCCRFSDRVLSNPQNFTKGKKILHIDVDPAEIDKNLPTTTSLVGDAKLVLKALTDGIESSSHTEWVDKVNALKAEFPHQEKEGVKKLTPEYIMHSISDNANEEVVITTEVGQNQMWAAQYYNYSKPRTFVTSGGLGTMGFGTGASMGAQIGCPDKRIVCISGDGSFRMNLNELSTVREYDIPIIIVIMNNSTLGMVRQWQTLFYEQRYSQTTLDDRGPDFKKLADAFDIKGYTVSTKEEFDSAIRDAFSERQPALIDARIETDEFVLPMVAPGKDIEDMILEA